MQIFEFHFNPKNKEDLVFDSFCYEPVNVYEKRMGSLYMMGILKNALPQNFRFLEKLAETIKEKYYKTVSMGPEKSLKESLKKTNEYLEKIAQKGDVSWLGNLSFAVFSLKNYELNFTRTGEIKIYLIRKGQLIDIDQKLQFEDIEPYPLKIFGNIVSGKLQKDDLILTLSKEVSGVFSQEKITNELAKISLIPFSPETPEKIKDILGAKREQLTKISGPCLMMALTEEMTTREKETIATKKKMFSLQDIFSPIAKNMKIKNVKLPAISIKRPSFKKPSFKLPQIKIPEVKIRKKLTFSHKNLILVLILLLFLIVSSFISKKLDDNKIEKQKEQFFQIEDLFGQAQSYLLISKTSPQAEEKAVSLLNESWQKISPLAKESSSFPPDFAGRVSDLEKKIAENLYQLNKLTVLPDPEKIFEFDPKAYIPQKMIYFNGEIYFFSPYSKNIFKLNPKNGGELIASNQQFSSAASLEGSVAFFSKPNSILVLENNEFSDTYSLEMPYSGYVFDSLASYRSNLYFLDKKAGNVIKYPYIAQLQWNRPQLWLGSESEFESIAVDGSVWLLAENNHLEKYYGGKLQKSLQIEIFPHPDDFSKIYTAPQLPYIYILEPIGKRVVIVNKTGGTIAQFRSEKFDNLLGFAVADDGKKIYLLNGLEVYQIDI